SPWGWEWENPLGAVLPHPRRGWLSPPQLRERINMLKLLRKSKLGRPWRRSRSQLESAKGRAAGRAGAKVVGTSFPNLYVRGVAGRTAAARRAAKVVGKLAAQLAATCHNLILRKSA